MTETSTEPQVTHGVDTHQQASQTGSQAEPVQQESSLPLIDKEALRIYKKIPMDVDCSVEDLVDEKADLRSVMKTLLKLEMARVIVILPGDRIKRILK